MFNIDRIERHFPYKANDKDKPYTLEMFVENLNSITTRELSNLNDAIAYLEAIIVETRDKRYVFEKSSAMRQKPNELWGYFVSKMDIKSSLDRSEYFAKIQLAGTMLGQLEMYHEGIAGQIGPANTAQVVTYLDQYKKCMQMIAAGGTSSTIYLSSMLIPTPSLTMLNFEWWTKLDSEVQSMIVHLSATKWKYVQ